MVNFNSFQVLSQILLDLRTSHAVEWEKVVLIHDSSIGELRCGDGPFFSGSTQDWVDELDPECVYLIEAELDIVLKRVGFCQIRRKTSH